MLTAMRSGRYSKVISSVLFGILGLAMLGLALLNPNAPFKGFGHSNVVATIGRDKISTSEFDQLMESAIRREGMNKQDAFRTGFPETFLQQEINSRVLAKEVKDLGIIVDDVTAARQLKKILATFTKEGMSQQEGLQRLEMTLGVNESRLVDTLKSQIGVENLMRALSSGIVAPAQMVDDATKYRFESRAGEYFTVTADEADKIPAPSDADLKKYYDTISDRFTLPEYRTLAILVLDRKSLGGDAPITDAAMKTYYDAHVQDFTLPEKRVISQVMAADEATAKAVYDEAIKTKNLKAAAAGKKANYIKSAEYGKDDIAVELADTAFNGKAEAVLPPQKSPLGWDVMYIEKIKPAGARSFEESKADIQRVLADAGSNSDAMYKKANEIDDMVAGGKSLSDVAQTLGLHEKLLTKVDSRGFVPGASRADDSGIPDFDKAVASGFKLSKGVVSQLIETKTGDFLLVETREIIPSEQQALEKVHAEVLKAWQKDQAAKSLDQKSSKILERLKMGEDFNTVAEGLGKHVQRIDMTPRREKPDSKLSHGVVPALFSLDHIGQVTVVPVDNSATILRFADRRIEVPQQQSKEDSQALKTMLDHSVQKDLLEQYRQSLINKYDVSIDHQAIEDMYTVNSKTNSGDEDLGDQ